MKKISIVIPTYEAGGRGPEFLNELLFTINYQNYKDFEVIVCDHSTSNIIKNVVDEWSAKGLSINYVLNPHGRGNASINANMGIKIATGDFIKIMHQDDLFDSPYTIDLLMKNILNNPELKWGAFGYNHLYHNEQGRNLSGPVIPTEDKIGCPSVSFFINDNNFFDENLVVINDLDIHTTLAKKYGPPLIITTICITVRIHKDQVTHATREREEKEFRYFEKKHNKPFFYDKRQSELFDDDLTKLANKYACDKGTRIIHPGHHGDRLNYTTVYHQKFEHLREEKLNILEIGIGSGTSLKMWYDYFPNATIHAIDIENCCQHNNDRVFTHVANQKFRGDLLTVMEKVGKLDIIIDDGGHMMEQQQVSLGTLFRFLKPGGYYFIEDLHTSYWPHNGFKNLYNQPLDINEDRSNTTVKMIEVFIETKELNSQYLTDVEKQHINENVSACELFALPETAYGPNRLALFRKKKLQYLIIGGAGFIGSNLCEKLASKGNRLFIMDDLLRKIHGQNPPTVKKMNDMLQKYEVYFFKADACVPGAYNPFLEFDYDAVIHLASETGTGESMYQHQKYCKNIEMLAVLADLIICGKLKTKKLILASSRAVYGEAILRDRDNEPFASDEEITSCCPVSFYGTTKQIQERIVRSLSAYVPYTILRFQNVYGPGQSLNNPYTGILSIFSNAIRNKQDIQIFEDGMMTRDFIFIDDAVEAISLCLQNEQSNNHIFNVGTGNRTTVLSMAYRLMSALKINVPIHITGEKRAGDIRHNFAKTEKIFKALGFKAKTTIEEGLQKFVDWVKTQPIVESKYEQSLQELREKKLLK